MKEYINLTESLDNNINISSLNNNIKIESDSDSDNDDIMLNMTVSMFSD
jgi:hypothetical protein